MRLRYSKSLNSKQVARLKNKVRIRKKVEGTNERPRLAVYRSARHIYAQLIDDAKGHTLVSASSLNVKFETSTGSRNAAKEIGAAIAKKAIEKNIKNVVFDRSGYVYHGRVKAVAEGAREGGLNF